MKNRHFYLSIAIIAMIVIITASNFLVKLPINDWLTWGAFSYPFSFFVTELTNYNYGPKRARQVVYVGFIFAVVLNYSLMDKSMALASCCAFLSSQLLDIAVFNRLRQTRWWIAVGLASMLASAVDTVVFFSLAFPTVPWLSLACGDLAIKVLMDLLLLIPFRISLWQRFPIPTNIISHLPRR